MTFFLLTKEDSNRVETYETIFFVLCLFLSHFTSAFLALICDFFFFLFLQSAVVKCHLCRRHFGKLQEPVERDNASNRILNIYIYISRYIHYIRYVYIIHIRYVSVIVTSGKKRPRVDIIFTTFRGVELQPRINALLEVHPWNCRSALSKYHGDCGINGMTAAHTSSISATARCTASISDLGE